MTCYGEQKAMALEKTTMALRNVQQNYWRSGSDFTPWRQIMSRTASFVSAEMSSGSLAGQPFRKAKLFSASVVNAFPGLVHGWTLAAEYQELERRGVPREELVRWLSRKF
jgi:hypothetical protein